MKIHEQKKKLWRWLLLAAIGVTTGVIWYLSLIPAGASAQQSDKMMLPLAAATKAGGDFFAQLFVFVRKMAHFVEFFGLGLLWGLYARQRWLPYMWLYGLPVGILDELLQAITPGRAPGFWDVVLDYCGYFCGFALVCSVTQWWICRKKRRRTK